MDIFWLRPYKRVLADTTIFLHSVRSWAKLLHSLTPSFFASSSTPHNHLFRGLPLALLLSKFLSSAFFGIRSSSIRATCPAHRNLADLIAPKMVSSPKISV